MSTAQCRSFAVVLLVLTWSSSVRGGDIPQAFDATYVIRVGGLTVGQMERSLRILEDQIVQFESITRASGVAVLLRPEVVREISRWRQTAVGNASISYEYSRTGGRRERQQHVVFDHGAGTISTTTNGAQTSAMLLPGTVDRLAYQALLMQALASGVIAPEFPVVDGAEIKTYAFERGGDEELRIAAGRYLTTRLQRRASSGSGRTVFWCAAALGYLPVRVDSVDDDGQVTTIELRRFTPLPAGA